MPKKANPDEPKEGLAWFRARVPMTKKAWLKLTERAQAKAFTIARVAQLTLVAEVQEKLAAALKRGESFESFKAKVSAGLTKAWGEERPWHIETIFRNANQRAYTAGRRAQMTAPAVIRERPFWVLTPLLDPRTTAICRALSPRVVLPAEHKFWRTRWPPLHHNCRTLVYSISADAARAMGITRKVPRVAADDGFGHADPLEWQPDLKRFPPKLVKVYRRGK